MRQCPRHQAPEGYICFFSECPTRKTHRNLLCHECYFQDDDESPHHHHIDSCIYIQDLLNDFSKHVNTITDKEQKLHQYISQCQNHLVNLAKKKQCFNGLMDELNKYMTGTVNKLMPTIMNTLEKVAIKPLHFVPEHSYQVFSDHFAEKKVLCSCSNDYPKSVQFLCLEKNIPMGKRTSCADCNCSQQRNIGIDEARPIIQRAEQEEMYFNEMLRVKKYKLEIENLMARSIVKIRDFIQLQIDVLYVKAILKQHPGRQQYQHIAEFLSSYYPTSGEQYDYRELTEVVSNLKNVHRHLKELNEFFSNHDVLQRGFNQTIICEIYRKNDFKENKILVVDENYLVRDFINLIIQLCPYLGEKQTKIKLLNNYDFDKIQNQLLQSIINSNPKVKLIYI